MRYRKLIGIGALVAGLLALIILGLTDLRLYVIVHAVRHDVLG
jgi:hypothetical protein